MKTKFLAIPMALTLLLTGCTMNFEKGETPSIEEPTKEGFVNTQREVRFLVDDYLADITQEIRNRTENQKTVSNVDKPKTPEDIDAWKKTIQKVADSHFAKPSVENFTMTATLYDLSAEAYKASFAEQGKVDLPVATDVPTPEIPETGEIVNPVDDRPVGITATVPVEAIVVQPSNETAIIDLKNINYYYYGQRVHVNMKTIKDLKIKATKDGESNAWKIQSETKKELKAKK